MSVRVRFAPSPTGHLHVGNVRTALFNWLLARQKAGTFILRIEDTDAERSEARFEHQLLQDLSWLGLQWDEGVEIGGPFGPYRQTDRFGIYREHADRLLAASTAYRCFCTPEQLEADREAQLAAGESIRYVGRCRELDPAEVETRLAAGESATVRLRVRPGKVCFNDLVFGHIEVDTSTIGDFILLRSDGSAQYNFACVIDDALMEISHVIRGEGHLSNTHRQLLVYESLGIAPPAFGHLSTILGPDGSKLSKRHGATSISEFRELGYLPEALINYLSLLGWSPSAGKSEVLPIADIIDDFDLARVQMSPATFDPEKLNFVNRAHLKACTAEMILTVSRPYFQQAGFIDAAEGTAETAWLSDLVSLTSNYIDRLADLPEVAKKAFSFDPEIELQTPEVQSVLAETSAVTVMTAFRSLLQEKGGFIATPDLYREVALATKERTGVKGKALFHPIRVALTAKASGPELERLVALIDRGSRLQLPQPILGSMQRIDRVFALLNVAP